MKALAIVAMLALLPGCPTPTQYGGPIAVDTAGFAVRMQWLCRWGMQGAKASACLAEAQQAGAEADAGEAPEEPAPPESVESPAPMASVPSPMPVAGGAGDAGPRPLQAPPPRDHWCSRRTGQ
jgi:hypothetical protein